MTALSLSPDDLEKYPERWIKNPPSEYRNLYIFHFLEVLLVNLGCVTYIVVSIGDELSIETPWKEGSIVFFVVFLIVGNHTFIPFLYGLWVELGLRKGLRRTPVVIHDLESVLEALEEGGRWGSYTVNKVERPSNLLFITNKVELERDKKRYIVLLEPNDLHEKGYDFHFGPLPG